MSDLTAPDEGAASSPKAIADELCDALLAFDHVDYNALTVDEVRDLLDARETIGQLCKNYRRQQPPHGDAGGDDDR